MYENIFTLKADKIVGKYLYPLQGAAIGHKYPEKTNTGQYKSISIEVPIGSKIMLTGLFFLTENGYNCFQIQYFNVFGNSGFGYIWEDEIKEWSPEPTDIVKDGSESQNLLNNIIEYNKVILENNLLCARIFEYCTANGVALPVNYRKQLYNLQTNLTDRNEEIKKHIVSAETGTSPNVGIYSNALVNFMNNPGIGFVVTGGAIIIIVAVVAAATAAISYAVFKSMQKQTAVDFKYSNELTADLVKYLPVEVYNKLVDENAKNAEIANKAIKSASGSSLLTNIKYVALGFLGLIAVDKFILKKQ